MGRRERLRCEGGNGEGEVESWQGPGVGEEGEAGRVDKKEWGGEGGNGEETGRGGWRGGNLKGEMGRGATGRGRWEWGAKMIGRRRGKRRGHFTDGYDGMPGWTYSIGLSCKQIECLG